MLLKTMKKLLIAKSVNMQSVLFAMCLATLLNLRNSYAEANPPSISSTTESESLYVTLIPREEDEDKENRTHPDSSHNPPGHYPTWILNLNDNTFFKRNENQKPTYYFPPLEDDEYSPGSGSGRGVNSGSMVTFYFLLGLFLLFSSMFFCWYFAHHESREALRRHRNRASRRLSGRRSRLVGDQDSSRIQISVIMPGEEGYHYDPPPKYNDIFASEQEKRNSPYILPTYGEIMSSQKNLTSTTTTTTESTVPPPPPPPNR